MGMLSAGQFLFISQARPLEVLSPVRPHPSIFNVYFFGSLLGQFGVHLALLVRHGDMRVEGWGQGFRAEGGSLLGRYG